MEQHVATPQTVSALGAQFNYWIGQFADSSSQLKELKHTNLALEAQVATLQAKVALLKKAKPGKGPK